MLELRLKLLFFILPHLSTTRICCDCLFSLFHESQVDREHFIIWELQPKICAVTADGGYACGYFILSIRLISENIKQGTGELNTS